MPPLIDALRDPQCYPHPAGPVEVEETHISWVLLAGDYAYKIKKPVRLPFLDFSTLALRRHFCEEELRLNRRTAPDLYLEVVSIVNTASGPRLGTEGEPVEYALKMGRFPGGALAVRLAQEGRLEAAQVDAMAAAVAAFHAQAPRARVEDPYGDARSIRATALANFDQIATLGFDSRMAGRLARLRAWTEREAARLAPQFEARRAAGLVRECHGDLHLGNIALIEGRAVPFDCIEFDPALRWIDIASEIAFLVMDLFAHDLDRLAWRALDGWLAATGEHESVSVLRFYLAYRAVVRAKVAALGGRERDFRRYLACAEVATRRPPLALVLTHGVAGAGKSTLAHAALEKLGALRIRSDLERKRLHGIAPLARSAGEVGAGIYSTAASALTYDRLAALARSALQAGFPVIVDAAFLRRAERERFGRLAREAGAAFLIADCSAPGRVLSSRVAARRDRGSDASDAGLEVLQHQMNTREPLGAEEMPHVVAIDTSYAALLRRGVERIAARLAAAREGALAAH